MCRVAITQFEESLSSVRLARHWVADHLHRWELPELTSTATLLTSELVANAVAHTGSDPAVSVSVAEGIVEIGVSDRERRLPRLARPAVTGGDPFDDVSLDAEGGRGLLLVDALADEWGATSLAEGKHVWFRANIGHWPYQSFCRCHHVEAGRVRLKSGRYALPLPGPWDDPA